jgi:hypothetical protein
MITRLLAAGIGLLAFAGAAGAGDIAPGLWELALNATVEAEPGFQPGPVTVNQCISLNDTRDMSKVLAPITGSGATDCRYLEKSYVGEMFRFVMQCAGTLDLSTAGEVTFSATMMHGTITTSTIVDGKRVEFKSVISGRRLGDC